MSSAPAQVEADLIIVRIDGLGPEPQLSYMMRCRATGEEYIMFDPPGGTFRDLGDEYVASEVTGIRLRDRRDGYWKNGECVAFRPEGEIRDALLKVSYSGNFRLISIPPLDRTQVFPDGYEVIEGGSEDGWLVWQWCMENAQDDWEFVNLGSDGGPWINFRSPFDHIAFIRAFPELFKGGDEEAEV